MKKVFLLILFSASATYLSAQVKKSNNSGLDSLKQSVKDLGRLFKKADEISLQIMQVEANDQRVAGLLKSIKQVKGVTKVKEQAYANAESAFTIYYKGDGTELWSYVPGQHKLAFEVLALNDSAIVLTNKLVKQAAPTVETSGSPTSDQPATGTESKPNNNPDMEGPVPAGNQADQPSLTKGAALLFSGVKSALSNKVKNQMYKQLDFVIAKDGKQFAVRGGEEYPFAATVYPADLNKDAVEEVFVFFGNSYTSGMTGSSIAAFIADINGAYQFHLGFPGTLPDVLATGNLGYPDLLIGGPGFEFPIQRWDGKTYKYHRRINDKDFEKLKKTSLEELSKLYTDTIK